MQPAAPDAATRRMSAAFAIPPEATTGSGTAAIISDSDCRFGPASMPSFAMSV